MEEGKLRERTANATLENDWETWDNWNDDLEKALPNWDRWNNDLKQLLPDEDKPVKETEPEPSEPATPANDAESGPEPLKPVRAVEPGPKAVAREGKVSELPRKQEILSSDKQLLFFIQKYKQAERICKEAGISLRTLQYKVG